MNSYHAIFFTLNEMKQKQYQKPQIVVLESDQQPRILAGSGTTMPFGPDQPGTGALAPPLRVKKNVDSWEDDEDLFDEEYDEYDD